MNRLSLREHRSTLIVTALSAAFGVVLIQGSSWLATIISADQISERGSVGIALAMVVSVFIVIAVYVASIVTANTFATIIAGRTRQIALMRLIGASAASLRRAVTREGLVVGLLGSVLGAATGVALSLGVIRAAVATGGVPDLEYGLVDPLAVLPLVVVALSTWAASWVGSRRVLQVSPMQAIGAAQEQSREETLRRPVRNVISGILFFGGFAVLVGGVALGLVTPLGFLVAFLGGVVSFSGVVTGAHLVMPPLLRLTGRMLGSGAAARLAAENGVRYPERSSRTTIGLVIGVTLITTFAVASGGYFDMIMAAQANQPEAYQGVDDVLVVTVAVFSALIGFSALIAAFGVINSISLGVVQRRRELGLLRALGFTAGQVRRMIVAESVQLTVTGVGLGLVLGIVYGWAGAQSLLGAVFGSPGLSWPSVPWALLLVLALGSALLTLAASLAPARRATKVSPVLALAMD